jgi:hypothetical protein
MRPTRFQSSSSLVLLLCLTACSDVVKPVRSASDAGATPSIAAGAASNADSAAVQLLTRGIATAMNDPVVRRQVLEDLRDSPFRRHKLDLKGYLRGSRGNALASASSRAVGRPVEALLNAADVGGGLEFWEPRAIDRTRWNGNDSIAVIGTILSPGELKPVSNYPGFDVAGRVVAVNIAGWAPRPYLAIDPSMQSFGQDPEGSRAAAPHRNR